MLNNAAVTRSEFKVRQVHIEAAKALLANPDIAVIQIAQRLGVDALSLHPGRANREHARRLTTAALPQRPDAPRGFQPGGERRQCADSGHTACDD